MNINLSIFIRLRYEYLVFSVLKYEILINDICPTIIKPSIECVDFCEQQPIRVISYYITKPVRVIRSIMTGNQNMYSLYYILKTHRRSNDQHRASTSIFIIIFLY
jgi:hypothetical protein